MASRMDRNYTRGPLLYLCSSNDVPNDARIPRGHLLKSLQQMHQYEPCIVTCLCVNSSQMEYQMCTKQSTVTKQSTARKTV